MILFFLDTGLEFPQMEKHIEKVEKYICRKITKLKSQKSFEYYMFEHERIRGKNKGKKGYSWPYLFSRWCTTKLKTEVSNRYLKQNYNPKEVILYQGIAVDEPKRLKSNAKNALGSEIRYPLAEWNMTEKDALNYCKDKGFDWGGLYEKFDRVSCWCCPLQSLKSLRVLYNDFPELWQKLKDWDSRTYLPFKLRYSLEELEHKFNNEK